MKAEGDSPRKKKQEEQQEVWKWYGHSKIPARTSRDRGFSNFYFIIFANFNVEFVLHSTMSSRGIRFLGIKIGFKVPKKRIFLLVHRADVNLRKATSNRGVCSLGTKIYKLFKNRISYVAP